MSAIPSRIVPAPAVVMPERHPDALPRLAVGAEAPVASPVHRMQAELWAFQSAEEALGESPYPGWFRLGFPVATSAVLWGAIAWGVGLFG